MDLSNVQPVPAPTGEQLDRVIEALDLLHEDLGGHYSLLHDGLTLKLMEHLHRITEKLTDIDERLKGIESGIEMSNL